MVRSLRPASIVLVVTLRDGVILTTGALMAAEDTGSVLAIGVRPGWAFMNRAIRRLTL